ncbi:MAG: hypothetical protein ABJB55_00755 [Actinomycetota bacterium]
MPDVMRRVGALVALLAAVPLLMAARDPRGDVTVCGSNLGATGGMADVVAVEATAQELGTAAVWRLRFAEPLDVPDPNAPPMRVDILVRDPKLPAVTMGDERGLNRVVRWIASSPDRPIVVVWVPEHSRTPFNPAVIDGRTLEIRVPGRILLGESRNGGEAVRRLRWSVFVRDGDRCDRVGDRPTLRLREAGSSRPPSPAPTSAPSEPSKAAAGGDSARVAIGVIGVALLGLWALRRFSPR